jgi:feruloyl esterase
MFHFARRSGAGNRCLISAIFAILLCLASTPAFARMNCSDVLHVQIPDVRIEAAEEIQPNPIWKIPSQDQGVDVEMRVPFCRVTGIIEKEMAFELWLPDAWNHRYLGVGNGGDAGFIRSSDLGDGVRRGFATASSNLGHWRSDAHWALGHPDRLENYEWRAHHLMAINAKKLIALYYGSPAHHAYYAGCSGGGMGGMNEAQRFPADYDGVLSGDSGTSFAGLAARWLLDGVLTRQDPASELKREDWLRIANTAIQQCDTLDGVKDGVLINFAACKSDIASTPGLTPEQVQHARTVLGPLVGKDGRTYFPAMSPGAAFTSMGNIDSPNAATLSFGDWTYQDPHWDPFKFEIARDMSAEEAVVPGIRLWNTDLLPFERLGHKLITYTGGADPIVPAQANVDYYNAVVDRLGKAETDSFFHFFLVSGMGHCSTGPGPTQFGQMGQTNQEETPILDVDHDVLSALVAWVEEGRAPSQIIASRTESGKLISTRPICAYPMLPHFNGNGDVNSAANWSCTYLGEAKK